MSAIELAVSVFVCSEVTNIIQVQIILLLCARIIYPQDYNREAVRKIFFRHIPIGTIEAAKGKEAIVDERNRKIYKLRRIFTIINSAVAVLIFIFRWF